MSGAVLAAIFIIVGIVLLLMAVRTIPVPEKAPEVATFKIVGQILILVVGAYLMLQLGGVVP